LIANWYEIKELLLRNRVGGLAAHPAVRNKESHRFVMQTEILRCAQNDTGRRKGYAQGRTPTRTDTKRKSEQKESGTFFLTSGFNYDTFLYHYRQTLKIRQQKSERRFALPMFPCHFRTDAVSERRSLSATDCRVFQR